MSSRASGTNAAKRSAYSKEAVLKREAEEAARRHESSNSVPDCDCVDECSGDPTSRACRQLPPIGPAIPNSEADKSVASAGVCPPAGETTERSTGTGRAPPNSAAVLRKVVVRFEFADGTAHENVTYERPS